MIVAPAMKDKDGNIYVGRNAHSELLVLYTEKFRDSEQGFLTSDCRFVDRVEGLAIAKKYNQIVRKHGLDTELYSEDIFLRKLEDK
jgi:hypothetical protein